MINIFEYKILDFQESLKKLQKNYLILYKNFLEADPFSLPF